jgi:hypothetical protein
VCLNKQIITTGEKMLCMKKISEDQFFAEYPKYSNLDELKKADILVMPSSHTSSHATFSSDQCIFQDLSLKCDTTCLFFSEDQEKYECYFTNKIEILSSLGTVVTTIAGLIKIYEFLKTKIPNNKFKIKHVIKVNSDSFSFYEMEEFEGTIDDYKARIQEIQLKIKT